MELGVRLCFPYVRHNCFFFFFDSVLFCLPCFDLQIGDHLTLIAAAEIFNRSIVVLSSLPSDNYIMEILPNIQSKGNIFLRFDPNFLTCRYSTCWQAVAVAFDRVPLWDYAREEILTIN
jgi:hypothetical protein